jgi:hypothetical protein
MASPPDLSRIFSTAIVSTRVEKEKDLSREIAELMKNPAFQIILEAVDRHATQQGIPAKQAAEEIIETFRKIDSSWSGFVFQQGVNRVRGQA